MSLIEIENLSKLNELLPESLPRDLNVLVIARNGNQLTLAFPAKALAEQDRELVESVVKMPVVWVAHELDEILPAINIAYDTQRLVGEYSDTVLGETGDTKEDAQDAG